MNFKDPGRSLSRPLFGLLALLCAFPPSIPATTVKELIDKNSGSTLECYVCSSVNGVCRYPKKRSSLLFKCNETSINEVYGAEALAKPDEKLSHWPQAVSELTDKSKPGWVFAGATGEAPKWTSIDENRFTGMESLVKNQKVKATLNYKSCRTMKIWTEQQENFKTIQNIDEENPRVIRTCSILPVKKGTDQYDDQGCRKYNTKTATVEICYCSSSTPGCNGSSYLRVSPLWILAAALLAFVANVKIHS